MRKRFLAPVAVVLVAVLLVPSAQASHTFTDVPDTSVFHDEIDWLADAGITLGCNAGGTEFCPDAAVTRGQMAAFMSRLVTHLDAQPPAPGQAHMFYHQSSVANVTANLTLLDHPDLNGNPNAVVAATHMFRGDFLGTIGTWYSASSQMWSVYNEDQSDFSTNEGFAISYIVDRSR